jgi:hypothetical protein
MDIRSKRADMSVLKFLQNLLSRVVVAVVQSA